MTRTLRRAMALLLVIGALALPCTTATSTLAQLPTPVLDSGGAGDETGRVPMPGISYPILIAIALLGGAIGLMSVTVIRRWDRNHYPDSEMKSDHHVPPRAR